MATADILLVEFAPAGAPVLPEDPKIRTPKLKMRSTHLPHDVVRTQLRKGPK
jgi:hypothetical protein